jgi:hypothetical protein
MSIVREGIQVSGYTSMEYIVEFYYPGFHEKVLGVLISAIQ